MKWGAPAFTIDGRILLIMAAFKAHAAINFWRGAELVGGPKMKAAMGQFGRLTKLSDLPSDAELDALIAEAVALARTAPAKRKPKRAQTSSDTPHPDFAAALDANPTARAALESFPPSARRDYVEWIASAKQEPTRERRIATAIEWLSEGKRRNWRYEKC